MDNQSFPLPGECIDNKNNKLTTINIEQKSYFHSEYNQVKKEKQEMTNSKKSHLENQSETKRESNG